jgi:hypothetical protein
MQNIIFIIGVLFITSISVGIVGNTIGIGGGILLVPFFLFYMHMPPLEASGLSLFTIVASTSGGSLKFIKEKIIDFRLFFMIVLFAVPAAVAGSILSKYINANEFKGVFSFIIIIIGIFSLMATRIQTKKKITHNNEKIIENESIETLSSTSNNNNIDFNNIDFGLQSVIIYFRNISSNIKRERIDRAGNKYDYYIKKPIAINLFSIVAGFISGFIGIGIGGVTGTFLTAVEQIPPRIAFSTIVLAMIFSSIAGGFIHLAYMKLSFKTIIYLIPLMAGAIIGSQLGAIISTLLKSRTLRLYQGWIIIILGFLMFALSYLK